jgi:hypothetical protein
MLHFSRGYNREMSADRASEIPPAGPNLVFDVFAEIVIAAVRARLPDIAATRRGRLIVLRRGMEAMSIDGWTIWREGAQRRVMLSIGDRRDRFVAENAAASIAGALA